LTAANFTATTVGATLTIPVANPWAAGANRRIRVWTNLSGTPEEVTSNVFAGGNLSTTAPGGVTLDGKAVTSAPLGGLTEVTLDIPLALLRNGDNFATSIYITVTLSSGFDPANNDGGQFGMRFGEFNRVNTAGIALATADGCPECSQITCICVAGPDCCPHCGTGGVIGAPIGGATMNWSNSTRL
jgi:hypothetical protein